MINAKVMLLRPVCRWLVVLSSCFGVVSCTGTSGDIQSSSSINNVSSESDSSLANSSIRPEDSSTSVISSVALSSSSAAPIVKTGAQLYSEKCAFCHQDDGKAVGKFDMNILNQEKEELFSEILLTMPQQDPDACLEECSEKITNYIRDVLFKKELDAEKVNVGILNSRVLNKQAVIRIIQGTFAPIKLDMTAFSEALPAPLHSEDSGFDDNAKAVVSDAFLESLLSVSESVAEQVAASKEVTALCEGKADGECAEALMNKYAVLAFRKAVPKVDRVALKELFNAGANRQQKIALLVQGVITSPHTIYHLAPNTLDTARRLTNNQLAERLSLFLWQGIPDQALKEARATLNDPVVLREQVERMMKDNKASISVRGFVSQWLEMQDPQPKTNFDVNQSVAGQLSISAAYLFDYLLRGPTDTPGTMADLYMSRKAFVKPSVSKIYGENVPANAEKYRGREMIELSTNERAGILTRAGFVAALSSNEVTSPTRIGNAIRERVLCQHIPFPADPSIADIDAAAGLIGREFVEVHASDTACAGCHAYLDDLGLIFENYNPVGEYRTSYLDGTVIDPRGFYKSLSIEDQGQQRAIDDAVDLSLLLSTSEVAAQCLAQNMMSYAIGRSVENDKPSLNTVIRKFKDSGYELSELLHAIVQSKAFTHQGPVK